jgi:Transposase IS66 family
MGSVCASLEPLLRRLEAHVLAAERLHADDTTVPVLAKGKTDTGRCWIYLRDDRPFGGTGPPAAMFYYSRDRKGEHPQTHLVRYAGILQADAYDGYKQLYLAERAPGPIQEAACWSHYLENCFIWSTSVRMPRPKLFLLRRTPDKIGGSARGRRGARGHHCRYRCGRHQPSRHMSPVRSGGMRDFGVAPSTLTAVAPYPVMEPTSG